MKIIVAVDSFKGCLSSMEAGEAARKGLKARFPEAEIIVLPTADGGEGTADALHHYLGGEWKEVEVSDPLGLKVKGGYILKDFTAIIELASASGLTLLLPDERNVMATTTFGYGQLIKDAISSGATRIICTLGGSATNDAGIGALQALGLRVFGDEREISLPVKGGDLPIITGFDTSETDKIKEKIRVIYLYDADIDFHGPHGAAMMYASQKGATEEECKILDKAMERLCSIKPFSLFPEHIPGSGAAGGTGGGLAVFLGAEPVKGIDFLLKAAQFDKLLTGSDLVITGEGCADAQTRQGKVASGILEKAREAMVPVILIAGKVKEKNKLLSDGYAQIININEVPYDDGAGSDNAAFHPDADPLNPEVAKQRIEYAMSHINFDI